MKQPKPRFWKRWAIFGDDGALYDPYGETTLFHKRAVARNCAPVNGFVHRVEIREITPKRRKP